MLADEVKKYDTAELISFLRGRDLVLDEDNEKILRKEKIIGRDFLDLTREELEQNVMKLRPTKRLESSLRSVRRKIKGFFDVQDQERLV